MSARPASGFLAGTWSVTRPDGGAHVLLVEPLQELSAADAAAAQETGRRLLAFVTGDEGTGRVEVAG